MFKPPTQPHVRIRSGWLLQRLIDGYTEDIPDFKYEKQMAPSKYKEIWEDRISLWSKVQVQIIQAMKDITGLDFYASTVDVFLVYGYQTAFSSPLVISTRYEGDHFIDVLTHEILHVILTDNTLGINSSAWVEKKFPEAKEKTTINHILLHAIHEAIYRDVLKVPVRLTKNIESDKRWPSYTASWDIVRKYGYRKIIADYRKENSL